jgi:hypothetical protein
VVQREVEDLEVLRDPRRGHGFRDRDQAVVQMPAQHHLGRGLPVLLGDLRQGGVLQQLALPQRTPRFGGDVVAGVELPQLRLLKTRVQLDLVQDRGLAGLVHDLLKMRDRKVRDPDRPGASLLLDPQKRLPAFPVQPAMRRRPVDQVQVHIIEAEPTEAVIERPQGIVEALILVPELRGDKKLLAGQTGSRDGVAQPFLVLVDLRAVDRAVADLKSLRDRRLRALVGHLPESEAKLWYRVSVV